jgi:hypothetical protein
MRGAQKVCNIKGIYTEMSGGEVGRYLSSELSGVYVGPLIRHYLRVSAGLGHRRLGSPIAMVIVVPPPRLTHKLWSLLYFRGDCYTPGVTTALRG